VEFGTKPSGHLVPNVRSDRSKPDSELWRSNRWKHPQSIWRKIVIKKLQYG